MDVQNQPRTCRHQPDITGIYITYGRRRIASIRLRHDIAVQPAAQSYGLPQSQLDSPANLRALSVYHGSVDGYRIATLVLSIPKYSGLTLNQYGIASLCRTICTVCGFVALS